MNNKPGYVPNWLTFAKLKRQKWHQIFLSSYMKIFTYSGLTALNTNKIQEADGNEEKLKLLSKNLVGM